MYVIYVKLNGNDIAPIPCSAIFESGILGSKYMELHGVDERIKDNILPKAKINTMTILKEDIRSMISFDSQKEEPKEEPKEEQDLESVPKEQPKEQPKKKRKYVRSGKYAKKKKG